MAVIGLTAAALGVGMIGCDNNRSSRRASADSNSTGPMASSDRGGSGGIFNAGRLSPDELFINQTAQNSLSEIELGRLALDRSNNAQVRAFAQRMIDDHARSNEQLRPIANQMGMTLPTRQAEMQLNMSRMLNNLRGSEFDREYIGHMVADHSALAAQFQDKANTARSTQLRAFASQQLPIVRDHLLQAQNIHQQLMSNGTGTTGSSSGGLLDTGSSTR